MFLRFVISEIDLGSGKRQGVFHAGDALMSSNDLSHRAAATLQETFDWFNANLPHPNRFSLSGRPNRKAQAISWFRSTAIEHIARMRDYTRVLGENGIQTEVLKTRRPGYIIYEDDYQVVAYPFADTSC
jgi:hypothetical protein